MDMAPVSYITTIDFILLYWNILSTPLLRVVLQLVGGDLSVLSFRRRSIKNVENLKYNVADIWKTYVIMARV